MLKFLRDNADWKSKMKRPDSTMSFPFSLVLAIFFLGCSDPAMSQQTVPAERTVTGQVLLPPGDGSRGVEIIATVASDGKKGQMVWILFDEKGHFSHSFRGDLLGLSFRAGIEGEQLVFVGEKLPRPDKAGQIKMDVIDMRHLLAVHRLQLRAATGAPPGPVRVGMWFGKPPKDVSLGSRQFAEISIGAEQEWLVPHDGEDIYFLVERPADSRRDRNWWSGKQKLFGPFTAENLPVELVID